MIACAVHSQVVYGFNLDHKLLHVEDFDVLVPNSPIRITSGFRVKVISSGTVGRCSADIRTVSAWTGSVEQDWQSSLVVPAEAARAFITNGEVWLRVDRHIEVGPQSPLMLRVRYDVKLRGQCEELLHSGAVQPSDFEAIRALFPLSDMSKRVRLFAFSSRRSFAARVFDGSDPVSFPAYQPSKRRQVHQFVKDIQVRMQPGGQMRASYFTIETQWRQTDPIADAVPPDMWTMWKAEA